MSTEQQDTPAAVLARMEQEWQGFASAAANLSDAELALPGVAGEWSGKDVLAHACRWLDAATGAIRDHVEGKPPAENYDDFLAWNARWAAQDQAITASAARTRCVDAYTALRSRLQQLGTDQWDSTVRGWVDAVSVGHFPEHREQFTAWRAAHPTGATSPTT